MMLLTYVLLALFSLINVTEFAVTASDEISLFDTLLALMSLFSLVVCIPCIIIEIANVL